MLAAISLSVRGLPCGQPNKSSAVSMCRLVRNAAINPITGCGPRPSWHRTPFAFDSPSELCYAALLLLDDIINLATDDKDSITVLLRKCLVLAQGLKNEHLKVWANDELNGYPDEKALPDYRVLTAGSVGMFVESGGTQIERSIPSSVLEPDDRIWSETVHVTQSIKSIEHLLEHPVESAGGRVSFPWNYNLVLYYQDKLLSGWTLLSAKQTFPVAVLSGIVDTVRTRVLNMALEIRSAIGNFDVDLEQLTPQKQEKVDRTIVNYIYGNVFVAGGDATMNATVQQNIVVGDWNHLETALKNAGITDLGLKELSTAVQSNGDHKLHEGGSVMKWIKAKAPEVIAGGVKMGAEVGKSILTELLLRYYGLKN